MSTPPPEESPASEPQRRRRSLTPEQRRLLSARSAFEPAPAAKVEAAKTEEQPIPASLPSPERGAAEAAPLRERSKRTSVAAALPEERKTAGNVIAQNTAARHIELRHAFVVLGLIAFLGMAFYLGHKFDQIRYQIMTRLNAKQLEGEADKFPETTAHELIEQALVLEKSGNWSEAAERLLAAKRKDLSIPGILFHVGQGCYDRGDLAGADLVLSQALRFGENVPVANYYRGMVAVRRQDVPAAIRFFEAAANAEPFNADLFYYWGEALRLDFKPRDAIRRYEQAMMRKSNGMDIVLCSFKIRLAMIEAAEADKVAAELEKVRAAGPLSADWLMTDAALQMHAGDNAAAARLITEARNVGPMGLWTPFAGDTMFVRAAQVTPEIAAVLQPGVPGSPTENTPGPASPPNE